MTQPLDKQALRIEMRALRRHLFDSTPDASARAARKLPVSRFGRFSVVAAYCAQGAELDPGPILQAILELDPARIQAVLPIAAARGTPLQFRRWRPGDRLTPDAYGIPSPTAEAPLLSPNLLIAPVLAFDRQGGRLGQGGGHYDRTLAKLRRDRPVFVLGVAFAGQEIERVPMGAHDQRLDAIVTEEAYMEVGRGSV